MTMLPANTITSVQATTTSRPGPAFLRTPKGQVLVVFLALLGIGALGETVGLVTLLTHVLVATLVAGLLDLPYLRSETGGWHFPTSGVLTGLIVAMILAPGTSLDIVAVASLVSILGKRLLRLGREHVFNPAALGLLWVGVQFGSGESWWGALGDLALPWSVLLLVAGFFMADRLNKLPLVLTFLGSYFASWTLTAFVNPAVAAELFRAPFVESALFLAFFMLTDPPTSPNRYADQVWYGLLATLGAYLAAALGVGQLFLLVGALLANLWLAGRRLWLRRAALRKPSLRRAVPITRPPNPKAPTAIWATETSEAEQQRAA